MEVARIAQLILMFYGGNFLWGGMFFHGESMLFLGDFTYGSSGGNSIVYFSVIFGSICWQFKGLFLGDSWWF